MHDQGQPIICGNCKRPISHQVEDDEASLVGCLPCDNWATLAVASKIANEYAVEATGVAVAQQLSKGVKATRGGMTFTPSVSAKKLSKRYRFIYGGIL